MGLVKCPHCELNYIQEEEKYCNICRRSMKGEKDDAEEAGMCLDCGENKALKGKELCAYCLGEKKRREKLEALMDKSSDMDDMEDIDDMDEIDMPGNVDVPHEDLQEIYKEFGDEVAEDDAGEDEEEGDLEEEDEVLDEELIGIIEDFDDIEDLDESEDE